MFMVGLPANLYGGLRAPARELSLACVMPAAAPQMLAA